MTPPPPLVRASAPERVSRLIGGVVLVGTGIAWMVRAGLGLSPWDVLHQGVADRAGIPLGTAVMLVGALVLVSWWPLRLRPRIGTVANALGVGVVTNLWLAFVARPATLAVQVPLLLAGTLFTGFGVGLYISAEYGPGPRDGLMTGIARRGHPVWLVRTAIEASALVAGWLLGGTVGVGTIVFVLAIGPLVHLALIVCGAEVAPTAPELVS